MDEYPTRPYEQTYTGGERINSQKVREDFWRKVHEGRLMVLHEHAHGEECNDQCVRVLLTYVKELSS